MNILIASLPLALALSLCNFSARRTDENSTNQQPPANTASTPARKSIDKDALKKELLSIAENIAEASKDGDIAYLSQNTTDDFQLTDVEGKVQNKNKALADVEEERSVRSWSITDGELVSFSETDAVLKYVLNITLKTGQSGRAQIIDTFVQMDGKWMLRSEKQTMMK